MAEDCKCEMLKPQSEPPSEPQPLNLKVLQQNTPHSENTIYSKTRKKTSKTRLYSDSKTPLPLFSWIDSIEVWKTMVCKDRTISRARTCRLFEEPTSCMPRIRSIVIDWIMEVCTAYNLKRNTFFLALDYIDRYLTVKPNLPKDQIQLLGASAMFVAAKFEEIYPPKLEEFSYVCDGSCSEEDILKYEVILLNQLDWNVNPMTPTEWLNLYMQIYSTSLNEETKMLQENKRDFIYPQYSAYQFTRISHLIDLFALDPGFLLFGYSTIAAAAMYFYYGRSLTLQVSGLTWDDLKDCTEYMAVFYVTLRDANDPKLESVGFQDVNERQEATYDALKICVPELMAGEGHMMQLHVVDLDYLEEATVLRLQRMGLNVRKIYVDKQSLLEINNLNNENSNNDSKPVLMFEIERIEDVTEIESASQINDTIKYFTSKTRFTFDEILIGVHNYINEILLSRRLSKNVNIFETN